MLVTGGRDGSINVWSCHRGRHLQAIEKAHLSNAHASKGLFAFHMHLNPQPVHHEQLAGWSSPVRFWQVT